MKKYFLSLALIFSMGVFFSSCSTSCLGSCSTSSCSKTSCCSKDAKACDKECSKSSCSKKDKKEG